MPRTLFHVWAADAAGGDPSAGHYTWLPGVRTLPVDGVYLLVNPDHGGWVAYDQSEHGLMQRPEPPQGGVGDLLWRAGLCARDGRLASFTRQSDYTEQLYFFEFAVTTGCNLACPYCFADARAAAVGAKATPQVAELFINRIAEYRAMTGATLPFIIEFTGGEPLLAFDVIRHTVEYAERTYGDLLGAEFVIQSNATLLTDAMLDFIREHRVGLGVSCDGFAALQDSQRPYAGGRGSHRQVEATMLKLQRCYPENTGSVIVVVTEAGVDKMPEIALYFHLAGFSDLVLRPMLEIGRGAAVESLSPVGAQYVEGLFDVLGSVITPIWQESGHVLEERFLSLTFQHLLHPYRAFMCERSPCGAARNICIVMPSGDVFPCNQSAEPRSFLLGNLHTASFVELLGSDVARLLTRRTPESIAACRDCTFKAWCNSPCPLAAYWKYGSVMAKSPECELIKARYLRALRGLLSGEIDISLAGRLAGFKTPLSWVEA